MEKNQSQKREKLKQELKEQKKGKLLRIKLKKGNKAEKDKEELKISTIQETKNSDFMKENRLKKRNLRRKRKEAQKNKLTPMTLQRDTHPVKNGRKSKKINQFQNKY